MVADIVRKDYRTADVFRKYEIEYCCGGNKPLKEACELKGLNIREVVSELEVASREVNIYNSIDYNDWHIDFLTDYIVNVHHQYLRKSMPVLQAYTERFTEKHKHKFPHADEMQNLVKKMSQQFVPHMRQEEEVIFPYIRQIAHAYYSKESYASLLVRTLRKPIEDVIEQEHELIAATFERLRQITNNYSLPENACNNQRVTFLKLKEADADLMRHMYLENNVLFPRAMAMEKELLLHGE